MKGEKTFLQKKAELVVKAYNKFMKEGRTRKEQISLTKGMLEGILRDVNTIMKAEGVRELDRIIEGTK